MADHPGGRQDRPLRHGLHGQRHDGRPSRPHAARRHGGALLGRRRHRAVDLRLRSRRRRHRRHRHPRAGLRVGAAVLRRRRRREARRLLRVRARRRLRRELAAHPGGVRRGQGRVGAQRHQGVDHQRRHRQRPRGRRVGRSRAQGPGPGQLHRPARHPGPLAGPEVQEARHPRRRTPPRSCSTTCACPGACLLGGKEKLDAKLAKAREAGHRR